MPPSSAATILPGRRAGVAGVATVFAASAVALVLASYGLLKSKPSAAIVEGLGV